jgi:molybdopterin-guanine dinucleotide biosynthesis protein A
VVLDAYPESGPLGAILTALDATPAAALIALAGDMPHVSSAFLRALTALHDPESADATVPESPRGLEPLCAVYGRSARTELARALASGDLSLQRALARLRVRVMRGGDVNRYGDAVALFRNINAPEDLS